MPDRRGPAAPAHQLWRGWLAAAAVAIVMPLVVCAFPVVAQAQDNGRAAQPATPPRETAAAKIAELSAIAAEELTEAQRQALQLWRDALALLERSQQRRTTIAELQDLMDTAPELLEQLRQENETQLSELIPAVDRTKSLEDLQAELEAARAQRTAAQTLRADADRDEAERTARRADIPSEIGTRTREAEEARSGLLAINPAAEPPVLVEARRAYLNAKLEEATLALQQFDIEPRAYDARDEVLRARKLRAARRIEAAERYIAALQDAITDRQLREADHRLRRLERNWGAIAGQSPALEGIYTADRALIEELIVLSNSRDEANTRAAELEDALARWSSEFARSRTLVNEVGLTDEIGLHLREKRSRLPELRVHEASLDQLQERYGQQQYRRTLLQHEYDELIDIEEQAESVFAENGLRASPEVRQAATDLLTEQRDLLAALISEYDAAFQNTFEMLQVERQLIETVRGYRDYIDERVLWIQSTPPIRLADGRMEESDITRAWRAVLWLVSPATWSGLLTALWGDFLDEWFIVSLSLLALLALVLVQRPLARRMEKIAEGIGSPLNDRIAPTFQALGISILRAVMIPAAMWIVAWHLYDIANTSALAAAVAEGMNRVAALVFVAEFIAVLCRPGWLGDAHFDFSPGNLKLVRRNLRWFVPVVMPLAFLVATTEAVDAHHASLGRLSFIVAMVALAILALRVLHPGKGILRGFLSRHEDGWIYQLRWVWFPIIVLAPIALAIAAAAGYFYTAVQLERRVIDTVVLIIVIVVVHAILERWLNLAQRRLAIEQWRRRRAARLEQEKAEREKREKAAQEGAADMPPAPETSPPIEEPDLDVAAVSAQTQRLVTSMLAFAAVIGIVIVWAEVLPAFGILDTVALWDRTETISSVETETAVSGPVASDGAGEPGAELASTAAETVTREITVPVTLGDLLIAFVIVAITIVVSKNIPGLLEIVILTRLPLSAGARYAWVTIVRYAIVIVGLVFAFAQIGITWDSVQWLAAAITVGLGFGLQEIFANFVSGLIILFERPIRVGDTVTVGNVSGSVAQIRMRATTIVDWDRKELIIPNKEFVTGQVVNWTLSDPIMRVRISVGVAYGSDVELAQRTLLEVARKNPLVLNDPEPRALFAGFGDSSLNLELRVFINHIDNYIPVQDRLHNEINKAFREAKIEIPFPQRDLHLRSSDIELRTRSGAGESNQE